MSESVGKGLGVLTIDYSMPAAANRLADIRLTVRNADLFSWACRSQKQCYALSCLSCLGIGPLHKHFLSLAYAQHSIDLCINPSVYTSDCSPMQSSIVVQDIQLQYKNRYDIDLSLIHVTCVQYGKMPQHRHRNTCMVQGKYCELNSRYTTPSTMYAPTIVYDSQKLQLSYFDLSGIRRFNSYDSK